MSDGIVGVGKIGEALAHAFARKNIEVAVASRPPPEGPAPQARAIGPRVMARSLPDALEADTIILAIPCWEHREVANALPSSRNPSTTIDSPGFARVSAAVRCYVTALAVTPTRWCRAAST
jgi:8-hydroxy-5-deazaflavin:NADPH oxidoreductase